MRSASVRIVVGAVLAAVFASTGPARAEERGAAERVDWWAVGVHVAERLETGRDVGAWAREIEAAPPTAGRTLAERVAEFVVLARADHQRGASTALERIADAPAETLAAVGDWCIGREQDMLARRLLELRPDLRLGWTYVLLRRDVETRGLDATLGWIRERERLEPDVWAAERARLVAGTAGAQAIVEEFAQALRTARDVPAARRLVAVADAAGCTEALDWVPDAVVTSGPAEDLELARSLARVAPAGAARLLRRALERDLGPADLAAVRAAFERCAIVRTPDVADFPRILRRELRHALLDALRRAGDATAAQELMEELTREMRDADGTLPDAGWMHVAGAVQRMSGLRSVERQVLAEEELRADDPRYWDARAAYYEGRREWSDAAAAVRRRIELTPATRAAEHVAAVRRLAGLLQHAGDPEGAAEVLSREIARLLHASDPTDGGAAARLAGPLLWTLAEGLGPGTELTADDAALWLYLAALRQCDHTAGRVLWRVAEQVPPGAAREAFWDRVEARTRAKDPLGHEHVGFAMIVSGSPRRAIAFLGGVAEALADEDAQARCAFLVVRAGIECGDWNAARAAWPIARRHLGPDERPERLAGMAVAAARDGAIDTAVELWAAKENLDRADLRGLDKLAAADAGGRLRARLVARYEERLLSDPECAVTARALSVLGAR